MSAFLNELRIAALDPVDLELQWQTGKWPRGTQLFRMLDWLVYDSEIAGTIVVPQGEVIDFASTPKLVRNIVDDDSPDILYPSVPHDYLYAQRGWLPGRKEALTRRECDEVLREAMLAVGASKAKAWMVFNAVRMFGGSHW